MAGYLLHGNGSKAAKDAGYAAASAKVQAAKLLKKLTIQQALANQKATFANPLVNPAHVDNAAIADATERKLILSMMARTAEQDKDRRGAIDVLNKMDGQYVVRHQVEGPVQVVVSSADERL